MGSISSTTRALDKSALTMVSWMVRAMSVRRSSEAASRSFWRLKGISLYVGALFMRSEDGCVDASIARMGHGIETRDKNARVKERGETVFLMSTGGQIVFHHVADGGRRFRDEHAVLPKLRDFIVRLSGAAFH